MPCPLSTKAPAEDKPKVTKEGKETSDSKSSDNAAGDTSKTKSESAPKAGSEAAN